MVVFQELAKGKRREGVLVVFLLRRPDGALEHEMEHRGATAINPTKGTFRIRLAPPLKPPLLFLSDAPPSRHSACTKGRDINDAVLLRSDVLLLNGNGYIDGKGRNRQQFDDPRFQGRASSGAETEEARDRSDVCQSC